MKQFKKLKFITGIVIAFCMCYPLQAQYITLRGNQFIDQSGQPFYPVICNLWPKFLCNACSYDNTCAFGTSVDPTDIDLMAIQNYYDATSYPAFGTGAAHLKAAFVKIKAMGFSTVRIGGWCPQMSLLIPNVSGDPVYDFSQCESFSYINEDFCPEYDQQVYGSGGLGPLETTKGYPIVFSPPYTSDYNLNSVVLPKLKAVLQLASDAGLNVILTCLGGRMSADDDLADASRDMLTAIATSISSDAGGHPEILAYEIYNEPHWCEGKNIQVNSTETWEGWNTMKKNKICTYTSMWYTALKAADPHHLITMGNTSPDGDVFDWDPAILKLDFNSLHPYPDFYRQAYDGSSIPNAINRFQAVTYWNDKISPMSWILDETGVTAYGTTSTYTYPVVWGTYADQVDYALQSQQIVLNNGGSGYGWWEFADEDKPSNIANYASNTSDGGAPYWGLITVGEPTDMGGGVYAYDNSLDKPIVAGAFSSNVAIQGTAQVAMPADYYNAWNGCSGCFTFSGTVLDNSGNPIENAVIVGQNGANHSHLSSRHPNPDESAEVPNDVSFSIETFSKADGSFNLIAPVQCPSSNLLAGDYDYGKFDHVQVSAPGASVYPWDVPEGTASGAPSSPIILERNAEVFDNTPFELDINSGNSSSSSPYTTTARHDLITGGDRVEPTGYADFHASSMVDIWGNDGIGTGFAAEKGSYTHIYCAPVDFDCSQLTAPNVYIHRPNIPVTQIDDIAAETIKKDITVNYLLPSSNISLMPNPAQNYFCLLGMGDSPTANVQVTDALGHSVYNGSLVMDGQAQLNTSGFAPGLYNVHIVNNINNNTFKLMIVR